MIEWQITLSHLDVRALAGNLENVSPSSQNDTNRKKHRTEPDFISLAHKVCMIASNFQVKMASTWSKLWTWCSASVSFFLDSIRRLSFPRVRERLFSCKWQRNELRWYLRMKERIIQASEQKRKAEPFRSQRFAGSSTICIYLWPPMGALASVDSIHQTLMLKPYSWILWNAYIMVVYQTDRE